MSEIDTAVDKLVMLLSTDWFLPYWSVIGLTTADRKVCMQRGCRKILELIMDAATIYYEIVFTNDRLEATRDAVRMLAKECELPEGDRANLEAFVTHIAERRETNKGAWLFRRSIDRLIADDRMDARIKIVLQTSRNTYKHLDDIDFNQISAQARSTWDSYVRGLTPELPNSLADWVSTDAIAGQQFRKVLAQLTPEEADALLSRFQVICKSFTGVEIDGSWRPVSSSWD